MVVTFNYNPSYFNNYYSGYETIIKFKNNMIPALTSLTNIASLSTSGYDYQYYPNVNLCSYTKNVNSNSYSLALGTFSTSIDQQVFQLSFVQTFTSDTNIRRAWFGSHLSDNTISIASIWTSSSFAKGSNIATSNSMDLYTVSWSANYLSFP
jgi:hypothetical protein